MAKKDSGYAKRLSKMQDNWETSKEEGFGGFPDGSYKFQLQNAEITESQSSDRLQIHREHLCLEGEQAGNVMHDYLQLETEWGPRFVMQWIEQMGREIPDSAAELEETVAEISEAAPVYMGKVKNKDGFANLKITKLLQGSAEMAATGNDDDEETDDDDCFGSYDPDDDTCADCADKKKCKKATAEAEEETDDDVDDDDVDDDDVDDDDVDDDDVDDDDVDDDDVDDDDLRDELVGFCQAQDVEVDDDDTVESLTEKINGYEWDAKELLDEEKELLESIGATVIEEKKKKKEKAKKSSGKKGKGKDKKGKKGKKGKKK